MWSCNQNRSEVLCEYMLLMGAGGQGPQAREDTAQRGGGAACGSANRTSATSVAQ